jgi:hypothetical protein
MNTQEVCYVVNEENTLGYLDQFSNMMGVLQGSVLKGGSDWKNGPIFVSKNNVRPATEKDFDFFRCALPPDFNQCTQLKIDEKLTAKD